MTTTISDGTTTITPKLVLGYEVSQESRNVVHTILGRAAPDITLHFTNLRTGTLEMLFENAIEAEEARQLHINPIVFSLASSEIPEANMDYVVSGSVSTVLEDETRKLWTVSVDFQEVQS
jgi:hypothetical protein